MKSAFFNGELEEKVYLNQPPGFEIKGKEEYVYKLDKALYGLKQAPRAWNKKIDSFLVQQGFMKCVNEHGIYCRNTTNKLIVCLYVDDMIVIGNTAFSWNSKKESMVALSSCEAEYIAASMTECQAQWINMLLMELQLVKDEKMELRVDSKSSIDLAKHPVAHGRSKHY